jgi:UDP-N-acetylmuramoyl-L-alanyl-D-glutamate--2,6-diaminopimelate ligase
VPAADGARLARPVVPPRPLDDLAARLGLAEDAGRSAISVTGVTLDSRAVLPGDLYAALPGSRAHGADFSAQALAAGAAAVITDADGRDRAVAAGLPAAAVLVVDDPRSVLGDVAAWVFGNPSERLLLIGITGTNGKTTTAYLVDAGLRAAGHRTGLLGTVQTRVGDEVTDSARTTPEAPDVQALLALMVERGCTAAVLEVSSHALALGRVDGVVLDVAVFTNLSQDHLDFHRTIGEYFAAKARLFSPRYARAAVVDVDDAYGRELVAISGVPTRTCSTHGAGPDARAADWRAVDVKVGATGSTFALHGPAGERVDVRVQLPGEFNVANATCALAALAGAGVPLDDAARGIAGLDGVPGRMEPVDAGQPYLALVDYAHTPDAVTTLLDTARALAGDGRVVVVLGCGGDRDPYKRPLMGAAAVLGADLAVLTSDNPRSEDPGAILAAMVAGAADAVGPPAADAPRYVVEADRTRAIGIAVEAARPGDVVVVAGKGHETGQEVGDVVLPFDDRVVLREAIQHAAVAS